MIILDKFSSLSKKYTVYSMIHINKIYRYSRYRIRTRAVSYSIYTVISYIIHSTYVL